VYDTGKPAVVRKRKGKKKRKIHMPWRTGKVTWWLKAQSKNQAVKRGTSHQKGYRWVEDPSRTAEAKKGTFKILWDWGEKFERERV